MVGVATAGMRGRAAGIRLMGGHALGTRHRTHWDEGARGGPFVVPHAGPLGVGCLLHASVVSCLAGLVGRHARWDGGGQVRVGVGVVGGVVRCCFGLPGETSVAVLPRLSLKCHMVFSS